MKENSLSAEERIKSKKEFEKIFSGGRIILSSSKAVKALYIVYDGVESPGVKIAAAISKKAGSAPWRNRIKRLIRESYRLNKKILSDFSKENSILLEIAFLSHFLNEKNNKNVKLSNIMPDVLEIMNKIKNNF